MNDCQACNELISKLTNKQLSGPCNLNEIFCADHLAKLFEVAKG